ncbi:MAG: glycosyltransferase [Syntrophobacteraceae bacterium]|nr:glycosyltransferase [Syntrophobacteraceae bacterium]
MRIAIDLQGTQTGSRERGIGRYSLALTKAILRNAQEHEIVIALNGLFASTIEPIRAEFDGLLPPENIRVWSAPGPVHHDNSWRRKAAELVREAFLAKLEPDVVHIPSLFEGWGWGDNAVTSVALFARAIPTAVTIHDLIPLINRTRFLSNPAIESWYECKLDQLRRADLLLAVSESSRQEAIRYLGFPEERVVNISEGAESCFQPVPPSSETKSRLKERYGLSRPFVMYNGTIEYHKNMEGMIRAYALLPESLRRAHQLALVCALHGKGYLLEALIEELGLAEDEIIVTGYVAEKDLIALYNLCEAFVFPSRHEGFGLPALEAMACGAPVIASNTSSLPEVIGREDALFDPADPGAIAERLSHVLTDEGYRRALIEHGLRQSGKFSWDESARRAILLFEQLHDSPREQHARLPRHRPKLAYVASFSTENNRIRAYHGGLPPELSRHYDIDVIAPGAADSENRWMRQRDFDWFLDNVHIYDRILYQIDSSPPCVDVRDILVRAPGVVVLNDFFLGALFSSTGADEMARELYHSHGYSAVVEKYREKETDRWRYPCNRVVVENALGVIVGSNHLRSLGQRWFGKGLTKDWSVIPFQRVCPAGPGRTAARKVLGWNQDDHVVCSIGEMGPEGQSHRILEGWLASRLREDKKCRLVFVGEGDGGRYHTRLLDSIAASGASDRISITGRISSERLRLHIAGADTAVQLFVGPSAEASINILDCMSHGLATIVNANGHTGDFPADAVCMIEEAPEGADLAAALENLWRDDKKRRDLGGRAREAVCAQPLARGCSDQYAEAIERFYDRARSGKGALIRAAAEIQGAPEGEEHWLQLAGCIAQNDSPPTGKQLLLDISELICRDAKSGIQRVVKGVLAELLENPPEGYRVEPVYADAHVPGYRYARRFTLRFLGCSAHGLCDEPVEAFSGDVFFGLDFQADVVTSQTEFYNHLRKIGVRVYFLIHDLLPILLPHCFEDGASQKHARWIEAVANCDGAVCVSRSVADELFQWLTVSGPGRLRPFSIGWSHNGADFANSLSTEGLPIDASLVLDKLASRPTFLMVGTIEPRKGHKQTLGAFEQLWRRGVDVNLVIVGKKGWMVEELAGMLREHRQNGRRLFWLEGISDEYLERVYELSTCLIAASEGEGFGLPLIEAARNELPILARDIPVFREVAGEHASYFSGLDPEALADVVVDWLSLHEAAKAPRSSTMVSLTWKQSTKNLLGVILDGQWYRRWMPDTVTAAERSS